MRLPRDDEAVTTASPLPVPFSPPFLVDWCISSPFGPRRHPVTRVQHNHNGVDYAAPVGTPVLALADGTCQCAAYDDWNGNRIVLYHAEGLASIYCHLFECRVSLGAGVRRGDVVGTVGSTGRSTGPHLHLSVRRGADYVDPLLLISR